LSITFEEVRFPIDISHGAQGGPRWATTVSQSGGGQEQRNINWADARHQWSVEHGVKTAEQMDRLVAFFNAMRGRATGFRFQDPVDHQAISRERFGTGDGADTTFQLTKTYTAGARTWVRNITKPSPDLGALSIFVAGVLQPTSAYTIDTTTGIVTFSAPPAGAAALEWTGYFDTPVRFDSDEMQITDRFDDVKDWTLNVVEVREIV
jgi:uncharacterized protein (TIGR02217 family)